MFASEKHWWDGKAHGDWLDRMSLNDRRTFVLVAYFEGSFSMHSKHGLLAGAAS